ncbi:MAG: signal recognition particle protein [Planctomycetota bacterium]|nr:signal recognition particle protein [Planctomycetota bacterium]
MFEALAQRFSTIFSGLGRGGQLTEKNIEEGIREVRKALLEADVSLKVVRAFVERVREKAVGIETIRGVKPHEQFVKVVQDEITALLGGEETRIAWNDRGPTVIMMVGLQGTGKTTTTAKLARMLKKREGKTPLLVAADVQRPAAIEQLKVLGRQVDVPVYAEDGGRPPKICRRGIKKARELGCDVVILDTAGRLHIDDQLMYELEDIRDKVDPQEIWLVVDAMLGQDAVTSAAEFDQRLNVSGIVLTKTDGDARGGAALAVREVTGKPIRYAGIGEKIDQIEKFVPERMAKRILGMGDVVGLVEQAQEVVDQEKAQEAAERLFMARFTLDDMKDQFESLMKMGDMRSLMAKLPGGASLTDEQMRQMPQNDDMRRMVAVIQSMTRDERVDPGIIHMQRRHRIARGSGTSVNTVGEVIKAHREMNKQVKQLKNQGLMGRMADKAMSRKKAKRLKKHKREGTDIKKWFNR